MLIMISGPYSAPTAAQRASNLEAVNRAAAEVLRRGHIPLVGANAAVPVVEAGGFADPYEQIMRISLALAERCDAILCLGTSRGVELERAVFSKRSLPVFTSPEQVPAA